MLLCLFSYLQQGQGVMTIRLLYDFTPLLQHAAATVMASVRGAQ